MAFWLLLAAVAVIIFVLLFVYDITSDAFYEKNFKGPKTVPFFGHTMRMKTENLAELNRQHQSDVQTYGSPVRYKFLWSYLMHISTPEHFEAIMKHSTNIAKPLFYATILPWLHTGLLTSEGEKWRNRRKLLTPAFHFQILREFHAIFNEHSRELVRHLHNRIASTAPGDVVDMAPIITMSTLDIICETAMGRTVNALETGTTSPYVNALIDLGDLVMKRVYSTWLFVNDSIFMTFAKDGRKTKRCLEVLHGFTRETIAQREKDLPSSEELQSSGQRRLAFLDLLLDMKRDGKLSADDVAEETDTFMFEGHDTTATALMWAVLTLGTYTDCQKKCREEIDNVLGNFSEISSEQLAQLSYLERCIKETQRIRPSVPLIGRRVDEDMNLDEHTTFKRGASIQMNILMLHRNPEHWPEPDRFDPDRFLPDNVAKRHPFAFAPFSAGARNCIGQKFAMTEMKMIMAYLVGKFSWESVDPLEDIHGGLMMVLRPENGVKIVIRPRD